MEKSRGKSAHFQKKKRSNHGNQFIGNKESGQGFADKRKKKVFYEYKKLMSKMKKSEAREGQTSVKSHKPKPRQEETKGHRFTNAQKKSYTDKQEREKKKEEMLMKEKQKQVALEKYNKKKTERDRKLCKRNFKGQPNMKNQVDYLLQKIQQNQS